MFVRVSLLRQRVAPGLHRTPLIRKRHMNDNFDTKTAIRDALITEAGLTTEAATKAVDFLTTEGVIDFPVATELYEVTA